MRTGALALLFLMAACGQPGGDANQAGASGSPGGSLAPGDQRDSAATVTLAASGPGGCSARWDDQPATPQQVLERSGALIERAIQAAGGVSGLTEANTPVIAVAAPANLGFACADSFLSAIRRSGVPTVLLMVAGSPQEAALADFALTEIAVPAPSVVLVPGAGGRLTWNGEAIGLDALPERLGRLSGGGATIEVPPGELELRPVREASFGQVHQVLRAVRVAHVRAALLLPSVPPPSRPPPAPVRPGPPREAAPPVNQAGANESAPPR